MAKYTADKCTMATCSGPHATGDGHVMAREMGAEMVHMTSLQMDPCGIINQVHIYTRHPLPLIIFSG
jgi:succinate dehydrogenase/fumarate reductase flavoprotein subunit